MKVYSASVHACLYLLWFVAGLMPFNLAHAHDFTLGDLRIDHPYATPSLNSKTGVLYFRFIKNGGKHADALIGARTTVSDSVEIHEMKMDGDIMKMRAVSSVEMTANSTVTFKHGSRQGYHLMLVGLKKPLKEGDRFPVWLQFKNAGEKEVYVWVQKPRDQNNQDQNH